ncbi:hypothetical protein [Halopiger goleimassiliensis]|uniref:hypothetical protein n=1 Tax=Halopiger goleimassiliensis TaxID=1293048 RepID=UPI000677EE8A|nr:hypothetical protein [Halopiger goleimassiliensis]
MTGIDSSTDFEELASRVRTQSSDAAGSDTDRVTMRSFDDLDLETLTTLLETAESEGTPPGDLVFVLSRANLELLLEREDDVDEREDVADRLGHPVTAHESMPDDTILLLAPDAIDGASIEEPERIACGLVGSTA